MSLWSLTVRWAVTVGLLYIHSVHASDRALYAWLEGQAPTQWTSLGSVSQSSLSNTQKALDVFYSTMFELLGLFHLRLQAAASARSHWVQPNVST